MMYYTTKGAKVQERFEAHTGGSEFAVEINNQRTAQSEARIMDFWLYRVDACTFPKAGAGLTGLFYFDCKRGKG